MTDRRSDGGRRTADRSERETPRDADREEMRDVSHTPPSGDGADRVWDGTRVRPRDGPADRDEAATRDDDE